MLASAFIYLSLSFFLKEKILIDCLLVALSIPSLFLVIWTGSTSYQLTPLLVSQYSGGRLDLGFCKALLYRLLLLIIIISLLLWILSPLITNLLVPGFSDEKMKTTKGLVAISIFLIPIQLTTSTFNSIYITLKRNIFVGFISLFGNILAISLLLIFKEILNPSRIIYCILIGNLTTLLIFIVDYAKNYHKEKGIKGYSFNGFFGKIIMIMMMLLISRSVTLIQNSFASEMKDGSIAFLTYTNYLINIVIAVLITPILNIYYTKHCESWLNNDKKSLFVTFESGFFTLMLIVLISASFLLLSYDFLHAKMTIIGHKINFEIDSNILGILFLSTSCLIISAFTGRLFYIAEKFRLVNFIDLLIVIFYTLITYFLAKYYGFIGIYISFFIYSLATVLSYLIILKKKLGFTISIKAISRNRNALINIVTLMVFSIVTKFIIDSALIKISVAVLVGFIGMYILYIQKKRMLM